MASALARGCRRGSVPEPCDRQTALTALPESICGKYAATETGHPTLCLLTAPPRTVLKTGEALRVSVGSNPTPSALIMQKGPWASADARSRGLLLNMNRSH